MTCVQACHAIETRLQQNLKFIREAYKSVIEYVRSNFEVIYSNSGMRAMLHRLGFVYKKPKLVPKDPDIEAQEIWVAQYEKFMDEKPGDVEVLFADAVHPTHNTMAAYGWIRKGSVKRLKSNSGRDRLNLHGAINAETLDVTVFFSIVVASSVYYPTIS